MQNFSKWLIIIALLAAGAAYWFFRAPQASIPTGNALLVGTNATYPPFSSIENGEIVGMDVDVAREVAHRIGKEAIIKNLPSFDALIPELLLDRITMISSAMTPTAERARKVNFSSPYTNSDPLIAITQAPYSINNITDLFGKTVIVTPGESPDLYITPFTEINVLRLPTAPDAIMALNAGRADAFITGKTNANKLTALAKGVTYNLYEIPDTDVASALALSKSHPELLEPINQALQEMRADGTLDRLLTKWGIQ